MAEKPTWKGGMGFGMVNVPVKVFTATDEKSVSFSNLHNKCMGKLKQPKHCPTCGVDVDTAEIVSGYEYAKGMYVTLTDAEKASVRLKSLKSMDVLEFVDADQIDPRFFDASYIVAPDEAGTKAFSLFLRAMDKSNLVAVVKLTFRTKEKLCAVRAFGNVLLMQTMFYADELKPMADFEVKLPDVSEREMQMATMLLQTMRSDTVDMAKYHDQYREVLLELINAKILGNPLPVQPVVEAPAMDVVDALMASINAAQKKKEAVAVA